MTLNYEFNDEEFEYEMPSEDLYSYLKTLTKNELLEIISDVIDDVKLFEYLEDELNVYCEDDAFDSYIDYAECKKDKLGYFGMSQKDFI